VVFDDAAALSAEAVPKLILVAHDDAPSISRSRIEVHVGCVHDCGHGFLSSSLYKNTHAGADHTSSILAFRSITCDQQPLVSFFV
jgi:hypothetical protein